MSWMKVYLYMDVSHTPFDIFIITVIHLFLKYYSSGSWERVRQLYKKHTKPSLNSIGMDLQ